MMTTMGLERKEVSMGMKEPRASPRVGRVAGRRGRRVAMEAQNVTRVMPDQIRIVQGNPCPRSAR